MTLTVDSQLQSFVETCMLGYVLQPQIEPRTANKNRRNRSVLPNSSHHKRARFLTDLALLSCNSHLEPVAVAFHLRYPLPQSILVAGISRSSTTIPPQPSLTEHLEFMRAQMSQGVLMDPSEFVIPICRWIAAPLRKKCWKFHTYTHERVKLEKRFEEEAPMSYFSQYKSLVMTISKAAEQDSPLKSLYTASCDAVQFTQDPLFDNHFPSFQPTRKRLQKVASYASAIYHLITYARDSSYTDLIQSIQILVLDSIDHSQKIQLQPIEDVFQRQVQHHEHGIAHYDPTHRRSCTYHDGQQLTLHAELRVAEYLSSVVIAGYFCQRKRSVIGVSTSSCYSCSSVLQYWPYNYKFKVIGPNGKLDPSWLPPSTLIRSDIMKLQSTVMEKIQQQVRMIDDRGSSSSSS